ncbi:helix-turn-helix transcriptional regulator [Natrarchaeobius sp. A-rgal3]|uniref:helix-turn-helix transcriptional regulator n=1 Tax=Natrarchaeobius versutus TaxID=1679078 RepID=UPI00350FC198
MGYDRGKQLFSSPHRLELLRALRSKPADTKALTDELSISRVTVQRHTNGCCELGWVRKSDGRYELTPVGEHVCEAATAFLDRLTVLENHEEAVRTLAAVDDSFDPLLLADARISVAEPNSPHDPIIHYRNAMTETNTTAVRGILPVFSELLIEVHHELLEGGTETEVVAPQSVLETAPPPEDVPSSAFTLYTLEETVDFGVTVTDETVLVGVYDDGTFVACIESAEPAFREWATGLYDRYRERATRVPLETAASDGAPQSGLEPSE